MGRRTRRSGSVSGETNPSPKETLTRKVVISNPSPSGQDLLRRVPGTRWRIPGLLVALLACLGLLLPFVNKAVHVDDPVYIWVARHIQQEPGNFYGFNVNWYSSEMPVAEFMQNPPLTSYFMAGVACAFGWAEATLHLAFVLPALGLTWGTYRLAERLSQRPLAATLTALATPAFVVCSTSLMSDTLMLCFWVWAVVAWDRGLERAQPGPFLVAGLLMGLCALTKYSGMSLVPLLLIYTLATGHRPGSWVLGLVIPIIVLGGYQALTYSLYGRGLLSNAMAYAVETRGSFWSEPVSRLLIGLAFVGGCVASVGFYGPWLWTRWELCLGCVVLMSVGSGLIGWGALGTHPVSGPDGIRWGLVTQASLCVTVGVSLLVLAAVDLWRQRDGQALLLFCWVSGTFVFATVINWTTNARSILPLVPAAGILVARQLDRRWGTPDSSEGVRLLWPLAPASILALSVAWADYRWAESVREGVGQITRVLADHSGKVWFQGHWGFQYYMEQHGGTIIDWKKSRFSPGDLMVLPENNTNVYWPRAETVRLVHLVEVEACGFLATMRTPVGAGFYCDAGFGPLPFVFGAIPPERYHVVALLPP